MFISNGGVFSLALLFILQNGRIRCQDDEKEKTAEDIPLRTENNSHLDLIHRDLIQLDKRPESSNIETDETKDIFSSNYYKIRFFRSKRSAPEKSIASIRKRLNEERKKEREELMADANPRMEPNETTGATKHGSLGYEYSKLIAVGYHMLDKLKIKII